MPDPKTTFTLSIVAGVSICVILLVLLSSSVVPPPALPLWPSDVVLESKAITARSAIVYDPTSGRILYEKNSDEQLPLASLTKLMAAAAVLHSTDSGTVISITPRDLEPDGNSNLQVGERWTLGQLITFGLVASSNDAMAAAAANANENIITVMNRTAGMLGLTHTYFLNPTGLDLSDETSGAYGSARDVALLAAAFLRDYPELFEATSQSKVSITSGERVLVATSTAIPLLGIPGFIGAKTGFTDLAGGNLVAAFDLEPGRPLIVAVLGSTREGRFRDIQTIISRIRAQQ